MPAPINHLRSMLMPGLLEITTIKKWADGMPNPPIADPMDEAAEYYKTITDLNDELQSRG